MIAALFVGDGQFAIRVGRHFFGFRSSRCREYWSERNRIGWSVRYLPFGLRAFYTNNDRKGW